MSYDPQCLALAMTFLEDHPDLQSPKCARQLAQVIQDAIEEEIAIMTEDAAKAADTKAEVK